MLNRAHVTGVTGDIKSAPARGRRSWWIYLMHDRESLRMLLRIVMARTFWMTIPILTFFTGCTNQKPSGDVFRWVSFENIPTDNRGKVTGTLSWDAPLEIKTPTKGVDTFVVYKNKDSILMCTPGEPYRRMFRKILINAKGWKAKPAYGSKLFFLGNYIAEDSGGIYLSFYSTKDENTIMQVNYTNPGNMTAVILFSKDGVNVLEKEGIIIDPRDESKQPERLNLHP